MTYGAIGAGVGMVGNEGGTVETPTTPTESDNVRPPGLYHRSGDRYDLHVQAQKFVFRPGSARPIRVPAGSTVTIHLTSPDVIHGFNLVGTNVNVMAIPGQVGTFTVRFEEPATYGLICHEYCGVGHHLMEGRLRVVPRDEFERKEADT